MLDEMCVLEVEIDVPLCVLTNTSHTCSFLCALASYGSYGLGVSIRSFPPGFRLFPTFTYSVVYAPENIFFDLLNATRIN
jgi:hypothetical protein